MKSKSLRFGLLGREISYSRSPEIFQSFWDESGDSHNYLLIDTEEPLQFLEEVRKSTNWTGFNVTIPYKEWIIDHLDEISPEAFAVGAVNTVLVSDGRLIGYNTDVDGFRDSLKSYSLPRGTKALVLGSGGASKAVVFALRQLGFTPKVVSRLPQPEMLSYDDLNAEVLMEHQLIVNTTPLGSAQKPGEKPPIPYEHLTDHHLLYDLIYSPPLTPFLGEGKKRGAKVKNGEEMLRLQAEVSWSLFQR